MIGMPDINVLTEPKIEPIRLISMKFRNKDLTISIPNLICLFKTHRLSLTHFIYQDLVQLVRITSVTSCETRNPLIIKVL